MFKKQEKLYLNNGIDFHALYVFYKLHWKNIFIKSNVKQSLYRSTEIYYLLYFIKFLFKCILIKFKTTEENNDFNFADLC